MITLEDVSGRDIAELSFEDLAGLDDFEGDETTAFLQNYYAEAWKRIKESEDELLEDPANEKLAHTATKIAVLMGA